MIFKDLLILIIYVSLHLILYEVFFEDHIPFMDFRAYLVLIATPIVVLLYFYINYRNKKGGKSK